MSSNCESRELAKLSVLSGRKGWHTLSLLSMTVRLAMSSFMQRADKTFHQGCCVALWYCMSSSGFMCHGESMCLRHPSRFLGVLWYRWLSFWSELPRTNWGENEGEKQHSQMAHHYLSSHPFLYPVLATPPLYILLKQSLNFHANTVLDIS